MSALAPALLAVAAVAVRAFVGAMLIAAGATKLADRPGFESMLAAYRLLPDALLSPVAALLPLVEVAVGGALLLAPVAPLAAPAAAALLIVFATAVAINLRRGRHHLDCGCGTRTTIRWSLVAANVALAAALLAGLAAPAAGPLLATGGIVAGLALLLVRLIHATLASSPLAAKPVRSLP